MNIKSKKSGFTLLEIIIVVIIVGVLASLALPKFFSTVEFSRAQEGLSALATIRGGLERFYVSKGNTYSGATTANIDTGDPLAGQPNAHFTCAVTAASATGYTITATRNSVDGGTAGNTIVIQQTTATITRSGTTAFAGIN
ncbi:MAG: prepilin-type N-terminal cleavage/methylation domain-containing protein [Candidatus Omnitrophica bacterium]|nr:prepilin-type N-terminal cleavage/methylation domain-containing protein [Candidatus Omnitrophota bacterium]